MGLMRFFYRWLVLEKLEPEYSDYRITAITVMGYFMVGVAIVESITMFFFADWVYLAISFPAIFVFIYLLKYGQDKLHQLANLILIYNLLTGMRLTATSIDNPALLLFMPITPLIVIFLVGIKRGLTWLGIYFLVFGFSVSQYYLVWQRLPFNLEFFITALMIFGYAVAVAIGMERSVQALIGRLKRMAEHDPLTKAYNRRKLNQLLDKEIKRSQRQGTPLSLLMCDIDHFKRVNDTFGHDVGDRALQTIAAVIAQNIRSDIDLLARFGGEEFVVMLPATGANGAIQVANRIRRCVANTKIGAIGTCTVSVGVAVYHRSDSSALLLKRADLAMYQAKQKGRNRTELIKD
jgi:diguanylate cyclase (GGDEF)-like protein